MPIEIGFEDGIPEAQRNAVRRYLEALQRYTDEPIDVRATVRRAHGGRGARPYVVDASLLYQGRTLAAHASRPGPDAAAEEAADRLRRQLRRVVGADVALRNEPRTIARALADLPLDQPSPPTRKPSEEREIVRRRTYADRPEATYEAISDLIDDDELFHLFVHVRTGEDVVVHRRDGDHAHIGLLHPRGSKLSDEDDDVIVTEPSRYRRPLPLSEARAEMDIVNHRFLYFTDSDDSRGKVLYLRRDGDYGLVEPE